MTAPPLPAIPCLRVRLDYTQADGLKGGNRLFFSYSGGPPSGANCTTLAGDIASAWVPAFAAIINTDWALTEVDVLDIATDSGLSGTWTGNEAGTASGVALPAQVASNIEFDIARRYRGGKPRMFLPPPAEGSVGSPSSWTPTFVGELSASAAAFAAAVVGLTAGTTVVVNHVNLSYYKGFTNITNSSGRERAAPTYRPVALVDVIEGYAGKSVMGSQKRRRTATSY